MGITDNRRAQDSERSNGDGDTNTNREASIDNPVADTIRETPLPWEKLLVLLSVRLAEPINHTIILPFVYKMVEGFGVAKSPKDVAFYSSLLFTSFSFCQALTIMHWGRLSDRIGRRPVLLVGLAGNLIAYIVFGLSKSFWVALAARSFNGLLAGNVAVVKSILAEISDDTNRARIMALLPLMWNIGNVLGASIGGIFADPAHQYPAIFGSIKFFLDFPYFLPCAIGCSITVFGLLMCTFRFEETLVKKKLQQQAARNAALPSENSSTATLANEGAPLLAPDQEAQTVQPPKQRSIKELLTPTVVRVMTTNVFVCLAMSMGDQMYPIFAATSTSDGGLGFESRNIGFSMAISGLAVFYMQLVIYPRLERKYGALFCYQRGQMLMIVPFLAIPFLSLLAAHIEQATNSARFLKIMQPLDSLNSPALLEYVMLWALLISLLFTLIIAKVLTFTSLNLLTANLAPSKAELGFMNGAQQMAMTTTRIFSPLIAGTVWAWSIKHSYPFPFNSHMVWNIAATLALTSHYYSLKIPESVNIFAAGKDDENDVVPSDNSRG
ncbi:hypothetical protein GGI25_004547 [Coemansia spiralis]|uniref:Major facilitator superfamily (MFS) profile domain-containing protein n=2 Tax=Coemansia TaxID=4863 RepID=A0A9W8G4V5_9FUNG|nr:hypothetical protein EDC05_004383 [Coemansia umbellata]KAJ2620663.1 hypothetical protein GGI26_004825 [Coemansia sp. RSA 1358]KAJ2673800.1 hypothetical protein GGI25_004547 [Coemansia spiralis]